MKDILIASAGENLDSNEVLVYYYDKEKNTYEDVNQVVGYLSNQYPDCKIIAIPNSSSLKSCTIAELEQCMEHIADVIKEKQNEQVIKEHWAWGRSCLDFSYLYKSDEGDLEIIGNAYDNPELMNDLNT